MFAEIIAVGRETELVESTMSFRSRPNQCCKPECSRPPATELIGKRLRIGIKQVPQSYVTPPPPSGGGESHGVLAAALKWGGALPAN